MKFREKSRTEGQVLYVPEESSIGVFNEPSAVFIRTLKSLQNLGFPDKGELEASVLVDKRKSIISNLKPKS